MNLCACCFPCCGLAMTRTKVREAKGIEGTCCNDYCCMYFCGCCTAVQLNREVHP